VKATAKYLSFNTAAAKARDNYTGVITQAFFRVEVP